MTERPSRVPVSLYRLQFSERFTFADAQTLVPYLSALGMTELYASPLLTAGRHSAHGYDISNHDCLNPDLAGSDLSSEDAHRALCQALVEADLGHILDIVPNHMGVDPERNRWWRDVLENGPSSPYAKYFDIDWTPVKTELTDKVLLPILGDQYGRVLERGELQIVFERGGLSLHYGDRKLPLNPRRSVVLLRHELDALKARLGETDPHVREFLSVLTSLQNLPAASERDPERMAERHREKEVARERLERLVDGAPAIADHIAAAIAVWNGRPGEPASFDRLHDLLELQAYRLAYWRTASDEINYRRFFDVNELAGIHMEDREVFDATHALILRLASEGRVTGLRVDHIDGLYDPLTYLAWLQDGIGERLPPDESTDRTPLRDAARRSRTRPFYVALEKILSPDEVLPPALRAYGTTTYAFLNAVNGLFVDRRQATSMRRIYARLTGHRESVAALMYQCKKLIVLTSMASEMNVLSHALNQIAESDRVSRDFTLNSLRKSLMEVIACFPVYRTYISARGVSDHDRGVVQTAVSRARRRNPAMESTIFDFLESVLVPSPLAEGETDPRTLANHARRLSFAMKFQQYTGPVHAKGVEDTAFYRHHVLVSLNEDGGGPERFGLDAREFHALNQQRLRDWPLEMIGSSTHDTKRGEDARARIDVLSEMPEEWRRIVGRLMRITGSTRGLIDGGHAPDRNDEYLYYQTLVGAWPAEAADAPIPAAAPPDVVDRVRAYMLKAVKEAKLHSSWVNENLPYEQALTHFVEQTLGGPVARSFLSVFVPFQRRVARLGAFTSLAQLAVKMTSPGVIDLYQGSELWDLSLVDPDNRRPVDFARRKAWLDELAPWLPASFFPSTLTLASAVAGADAGAVLDDTLEIAPQDEGRLEIVREMIRHWPDGRIKLFLTALLARLRREQPALFLEGDYIPLAGGDEESEHHLAGFARRHGQFVSITMVGRFVSQLLTTPEQAPTGFDAWRTLNLALPEWLAPLSFRNIVSGAPVRALVAGKDRCLLAADVFKTCPVAVLLAECPA